jgi:predicted amidohydrolase YtcJ
MVGDFEVARCNLSSELQRLSYLFSTLIARGGKLVFGSDSPIEGISVWKGIEAAITRSFQGGYWNQSEAISLASALNAHTVWPSQIQSNPHGTGALVVGNVCDFVLLNRDPFDVIAQGESLVHKMKILQTVQNGVTVYS